MKPMILGIALLGCSVIPTFAAQTANSSGPGCFDVVPQGVAGSPNSPILVNRCTGNTWFLIRNSVAGADGKVTGQYVYAWSPILVNDKVEPVSITSPLGIPQ